MSVSDLLDDWFESDAIKAMLTVNGVIGTWAGPDEPGTAYVMLHHSIGDVGDGHLGSLGLPAGRHGRRVRRDPPVAPSRSAPRSARTRRVKKILVRGGRAVGVALENGEELRAPVVVSCIHPQIAFLDLIERHELPADFVWDIERWKTRSRRRQGQRRDLGAAGLHREPRQEPAGPPHRLGRAVLQPAVRRARVPGRAHRAQGGGRAVRRRHDPDDARQAARARGRARVLDVQPVGARRLERGAAPRRARAVRRPDHRQVHGARAELQGAR